MFILLCCRSATFVNAQTPIWISSVNYESSPLVAPVVLVLLPSEDGSSITYGIFGWTLHAGRSAAINTAKYLKFSAELTPLNSHSSNTIYRNGKANNTLEYENATIEVRGGLTYLQDAHWSADITAIGLYERVTGLNDKHVTDFWKNPFFGIEFCQHYRNFVSDEPLRSRQDGLRWSVRFQLFTGTSTWWRADASVGAGKKLGPVFFRGNISSMAGNSLNIVNRFLIGGSWDILGPTVFYGHPYAEFRLDDATVASGGADIPLMNVVELGVRAVYMNSSEKKGFGEYVALKKNWNGIVFTAGVSIGQDSRWNNESNSPMLFGGINAALFHP